jgi:hypothetical protein
MDPHVPRSEFDKSRPSRLTRAAIVTGTLVIGVLPLSLGSAAPDVFNVELVVFRYNGAVASPENWDVVAPPGAATGAVPQADQTATLNSAPADAVVRALSPAQFQLAGTEAAVRRNSSYEPITHFGFRIIASERAAGNLVRVEPLVDAASGLTGTLTLERARFLHLALDLTYTTSNPPARLFAPGATPASVAFHMHQDRRMRPFERHYFDHPAFGVVAIVSPVGGGD